MQWWDDDTNCGNDWQVMAIAWRQVIGDSYGEWDNILLFRFMKKFLSLFTKTLFYWKAWQLCVILSVFSRCQLMKLSASPSQSLVCSVPPFIPHIRMRYLCTCTCVGVIGHTYLYTTAPSRAVIDNCNCSYYTEALHLISRKNSSRRWVNHSLVNKFYAPCSI